MPNGDESIITQLALLRQEVAALSGLVTSVHNRLESDLDDHEKRIRGLESTTTRLSERMTNWQLAQGTYTTVASIVSAIISSLVRKP